MTTQNDYESEIDKNKLILKGMNKAIDILKIPQWSEALQEAYDKGYEKGLADARREVIMEVKEVISKLKIITPEREPPKNKLTQNQIFASGQMNMLIRLNDVLATLREEEEER